MYVQRKIETRSCNHCCRVKAISITYSECVSIALGVQHAVRMRYDLGNSDCAKFSTVSHKRHDFRREKDTEHKIYFDFLYKFYQKL
jgi:hypothetical protein